MHQEITLNRDVEAIQIPSGDPMTIPVGTKVSITQSLGGSYTVLLEHGLARISAVNADALGLNEKSGEPEKSGERLHGPALEEALWLQLRNVFDPEIPVNIVDLGLVYDLAVEKDEDDEDATVVLMKMTLTAPGCGMGPTIAADAQARMMTLNGVDDARVELVWDPPWNQDMITEEGKMQLGLI